MSTDMAVGQLAVPSDPPISSFYGPGMYYGWVLIMTVFLLRELFRLKSAPSISQSGDTIQELYDIIVHPRPLSTIHARVSKTTQACVQDYKFDFDLFAILLYPSFALGDILYRMNITGYALLQKSDPTTLAISRILFTYWTFYRFSTIAQSLARIYGVLPRNLSIQIARSWRWRLCRFLYRISAGTAMVGGPIMTTWTSAKEAAPMAFGETPMRLVEKGVATLVWCLIPVLSPIALKTKRNWTWLREIRRGQLPVQVVKLVLWLAFDDLTADTDTSESAEERNIVRLRFQGMFDLTKFLCSWTLCLVYLRPALRSSFYYPLSDLDQAVAFVVAVVTFIVRLAAIMRNRQRSEDSSSSSDHELVVLGSQTTLKDGDPETGPNGSQVQDTEDVQDEKYGEGEVIREVEQSAGHAHAQ